MKTFLPLMLLPLVACGDKDVDSGAGTDAVSSILSLTGDASNGEALYASNCTGCHAADGSGGVGPALTESVPNHSEEELVEVIYDGDGSMPAYGETLSDQDIADLLAYLLTTFG